jgi:catechol 2,3-dioxygenase-like lactoylglutathione lyase family enzyme
MVYSQDVGRALGFYRDLLGFKLVEDMDYGGRKVYARLRAGQGDGTLALHMVEPGKTLPPGDGIRLYFEVKARQVLRAVAARRSQVFANAEGHALGMEACLPGRSGRARGELVLGWGEEV